MQWNNMAALRINIEKHLIAYRNVYKTLVMENNIMEVFIGPSFVKTKQSYLCVSVLVHLPIKRIWWTLLILSFTLQFQLPSISCSLKIFNGKFQKETICEFKIAHHSK